MKRFTARHKVLGTVKEFTFPSMRKAIEANPDFTDWKEVPLRG